MKKFEHHFRVAATLENVAAFHSESRALKTLTPFPLWTQIHSAEPLAENSVARFTIWAGPIPLRWEAVHTHVSEKGFTDTQVKGPYKSWVHQHRFVPVDSENTDVIDEVSAVYGEGIFWGLITRLMWLGMPVLFAYRAYITKKAVEKVS
jgi:ligand-binding SRPBCC domain-containing protein